MGSTFDFQTLLMVTGALLVVVALLLLVKQLFKLLLIVLLLLLLLVAGSHYAESTGAFDRSREMKKIGRVVDRVTEFGAEAMRKGKGIKSLLDTVRTPFSEGASEREPSLVPPQNSTEGVSSSPSPAIERPRTAIDRPRSELEPPRRR